MASDSLITCGNQISGSMKKITKTKNGWLVGASGNAAEITELLKWAEAGMNFEEPPVGVENLGAILVSPKGEVSVMNGDYKPFVLKAKFHAEGSGAEMAIGAMAMGASAEEAVKIAIEYNVGCGGKLQKVSLKD